MPSPHRRTHATALIAAATLLAAACGGSSGSTEAETRTDDGHYPVTVENCGHEVTLESEPTDVVMLKSAVVPFLTSVGVLDHVSAKAGVYPDGYFTDETAQQIADIDTLTDRVDASGHLLISKEAVVERDPGLVLGQTDNLSHASLDEVGIPSLEASGLCTSNLPEPGFQQIYDEVEMYGQVFNREDEADEAVADLKQRVEEITSTVTKGERTGAVLYPTVGGGTTYAYGNKSMTDPMLEAAGIENVFGDQDERVFEVTLETLLAKDPDVLVLLHSEGAPQEVEQAVTNLPGAESLTAVREEAVHTELFNFAEPASPLAVDGLERLIDELGDGS
ncbi:ABC transporter substrate-binding protein [Janibacter cremeus]|uniref:Iron complex transport system substrate-binding protein n=1 Tax=Janibacter cremeus TaxID=1285192 RepID=A0A852VQQ4_9MICO|nr:iron complex transport system substrate-binding protein [Janibacter cremeus]